MLTKFDWIRRSRTGSELIATVRYFSKQNNEPLKYLSLGAPFSATQDLCMRCFIFKASESEQKSKKRNKYCPFCKRIKRIAFLNSKYSSNSVVLWGYVNKVPGQLTTKLNTRYINGIYIHDDNRFLIIMHRLQLKNWLQELLLYHGMELRGLIQIFPTSGIIRNLNMGDYLTWAIHHETNQTHDRLWIRFFTSPAQLINPKAIHRQGLLTYDISEFIRMLELAEIFRAYLYPNQQQQLYEILHLKDNEESQFYWGRFLGQISQGAKDMLTAWEIRKWEKHQVNFFYKLSRYAIYTQSN